MYKRQTEAALRVESLVSKSLLVPVSMADLSGHRMLETIREFGMARLAETGEESEARLAVERALDAPGTSDEDIRTFGTVAAWAPRVTMETETRLHAASHALAGGRLRPAAALFWTATAPTQPGSMERVRPQIEELVRMSAGTPAQRWAELALVYNHIWTGRGGAMVRDCQRVLGELDEDDPFFVLFETWLAFSACAVMPIDEATTFIEDALHRAEALACPGDDFPVSAFLMAMGFVQARRGDLASAQRQFEAGLEWADPHSPVLVINLAALLYVHRRQGTPVSGQYQTLVDRVSATDLHIQNLVAIWRAASSDRSIRERVLLIKDIAERHRLGRMVNEHAMFLAALADLEVEAGNHDRARRLLSGVMPPEPVTWIAHSELIGRLDVMSHEEWEAWNVRTAGGVAVVGESPAVRAARAPALLAEAFGHWSAESMS